MRCFISILTSLLLTLLIGQAPGGEPRLPVPPPIDPELFRLSISSMLFDFCRQTTGRKSSGREFVVLADREGFQGIEKRA